MIFCTFSGAKNSGTGTVPATTPTKLGLRLVAGERAEQLLQFLRWRLERGKLQGELVDRPRSLVSGRLVRRQCFVHRSPLGEAIIDRSRERLGVAERIADPHSADGVLVVGGVAYERPAVAEGPPEEVWRIGGAGEALLAPGGAYALSERRRVSEAREAAFDIGADILEGVALPHADEDRQAVVGHAGGEPAAIEDVRFPTVRREAAPVAVVEACERGVLVV